MGSVRRNDGAKFSGPIRRRSDGGPDLKGAGGGGADGVFHGDLALTRVVLAKARLLRPHGDVLGAADALAPVLALPNGPPPGWVARRGTV